MVCEAGEVEFMSSLERETLAMLKCLRFCKASHIHNIIIEIDSLCLQKISNGVWKIPWIIIEQIEEIK